MKKTENYVITSAPTSQTQSLSQRQKYYLISMSIRVFCIIAMFVVSGPLVWVFVTGAVIIPYFAVVAANNTGEKKTPPPTTPGIYRQIGQ